MDEALKSLKESDKDIGKNKIKNTCFYSTDILRALK